MSKIKEWSQQFPLVAYLDSNHYYSSHKSDVFYHKYDFILAIRKNYLPEYIVFNDTQLNDNLKHRKWLFGYFSYDLKYEWQHLKSENKDSIGFDPLFFFEPEMVFYKKENRVILESNVELNIAAFISEIQLYRPEKEQRKADKNIHSRFSKTEYIDTVKKIKQHIQQGDIYELNFCQEFYDQHCEINAWEIFKSLIEVSPTPFSAFFKQNDKFLISSSPERYLTKVGKKLISQPIKGTILKSEHEEEDLKLKQQLISDPKERSENVMIVDLVRNDLSINAKKGSVKVEELFGIYPFKQLYQMISTVSSELKQESLVLDSIKQSFPMGSMTGAPKRRAMELIEHYEKTKRGLFSGSVGYFEPNGDFDFNVVIRSILYNQQNKYLSYSVGGAITINSIPEKEYEECLLKAKAIRSVLQ